ncbi:MAG: hypothetical protein U5K73_04605 [Halofilum sp. (in: g-proteobacteria)]|nr:hypothetical protein [Halofilum sp. (in: g-proteobacteria)]
MPDTHLEATRVISNQRGYYQETSGWDPTYVLELTTSPTLRERRAQRARERRIDRAGLRPHRARDAGRSPGSRPASWDRSRAVTSISIPTSISSCSRRLRGENSFRLAAEIDHCFDGSDISVDVTYRDDLDDANLERMTRHMLDPGLDLRPRRAIPIERVRAYVEREQTLDHAGRPARASGAGPRRSSRPCARRTGRRTRLAMSWPALAEALSVETRKL